MYKYSKEDYIKLANVSCIDVAIALGMTIDEGGRTTDKSVHIADSEGLYIFPDKNNWYRHSDGAKGFPIDLVTDALNCSREQALDFIARNVANGIHARECCHIHKPKSETQKAVFSVPPHNISPSRVIAYLIKTRGIDKDIVLSMIQRKMIAEDEIHHNCLFFGRDTDGNIRSCALRGTTPTKFRGEVAGGDKSYSFVMNGSSDTLRIFESPIDAMSHYVYQARKDIVVLFLNLAGLFPAGYQALYKLPFLGVNDRLVHSLDNECSSRLHWFSFFTFQRDFRAFLITNCTFVNRVAEYLTHRTHRPFVYAFLSREISVVALQFFSSRRNRTRDFFASQPPCDLVYADTILCQLENVPNGRRKAFVDKQVIFVRRVFNITVGSFCANEFTLLLPRQQRGFDFL